MMKAKKRLVCDLWRLTTPVEFRFHTPVWQLGYFLSSKWVDPHFSKAMPIFFLWIFFDFLWLLCSLYFQLSTICISLYMASLHWCSAVPKLLWSFRWYEMRQSLRLSSILYTYMFNKSRRLCKLPIRRVYVYSIYIYHMYVDDLQVEVIKVFKFPPNLTYE